MAKRKKKITRKVVQGSEDKPFELPKVAVKPEADEEAWGDDGLTVRQRLFVEHLLGPAGGVATKAAELAGYKSDNREALWATASRLLSFVNVQRALERRIGAKFGSPEDVRNSIAAIANGNAADYLEPDENGKLRVSLDKLAQAGALGLLHETREEGHEIEGAVTLVKRKLKLYDRLRALEILAKMNGQLIERHQHSGEVKFNPISFDGEQQIAEHPGNGRMKHV